MTFLVVRKWDVLTLEKFSASSDRPMPRIVLCGRREDSQLLMCCVPKRRDDSRELIQGEDSQELIQGWSSWWSGDGAH